MRRSSFRNSVLSLSLPLGLLLGGLVHAGAPDFLAPPRDPVLPGKPASEWEIAITPYVWLAGVDGSLGLGDATAEPSSSFDDLVDDTSLIGAMLALEVRKGRWAIRADGVWIDYSANADTRGPLYGQAGIDLDVLRLAPMLSYRLFDGPTRVDILAGVQYLRAELELDLKAGALPAVSRGATRDWLDAMVGIEIQQRLSERWFAFLRADFGGYDVQNDWVWQALGGIGYHLGEHATLLLGYRHLDLDYESGPLELDISASGFLLGFQWRL